MYSLADLLITGTTLLIIGFSLGALAIITAQKDDESWESAFNAGYEKGRADEQKRVMDKLEEWKNGGAV